MALLKTSPDHVNNTKVEIDDECVKIDSPLCNTYTYSDNCNIHVIENNSMSYKDFFEKHMIKNLPCILKNISANWECLSKWIKNKTINYEYLSTRYGDLQAPVADCNNVMYNSHCKSNMKVSDYMNYLRSGNKDKLLYLKDWHLRRLRPEDNFYEVPVFFASDWLNEFAQDHQDDDYMFVYIGPKDSWTPLHADVYCSYSWSVNITGKKKWILFPPGEEIKLQDALGNLPILFDQEKHQGIRYFEVIQEEGDGIFVPSGWYHQVANVLDTISINHNWINGCNVEYVWEALQKNIISVEHEIEEFKYTEEFASQCQLILKSVFGMDFDMFINLLCYIGKKRLNQLKSGNFETIGNYHYGINHIKFDITVTLKLIGKILNHPLFLNKDVVSVETENDLIILEKSILHELYASTVPLTDVKNEN